MDVSIWLTQFIKAMRDDDGKVMKNAHIIGTLRRVVSLCLQAGGRFCARIYYVRMPGYAGVHASLLLSVCLVRVALTFVPFV